MGKFKSCRKTTEREGCGVGTVGKGNSEQYPEWDEEDTGTVWFSYLFYG